MLLRFNRQLVCLCCLLIGAGSVPGIAAEGDNIALSSNGGTAAMSSLWTSSWPASNCINGVTSSNSNSQLCHTQHNSGTNEWLDITLAAAVPIDSIIINNRTNCCRTRIRNAYVLISNTPFPPGRDAASLAAARAQAVFEHQNKKSSNTITIDVGDVVGRYVRIQKPGGNQNVSNYINLLEVQVIEGRSSLVNLVMDKQVSDPTPSIDDVVTFTMTVTNEGPGDATDVELTDIVPAGFDSITSISNGGVLSGGNEINWILPSIAAGSTASVTFDARVVPP